MRLLIAGVLLALPLAADVKLTKQADRIAVTIDGQPFGSLWFGADANKPYFHPLRTANGKIITRQYPMAEVAGETRDHKHHRGLWFSHGDVNGVDFWANDPSYKAKNMGRIVLASTGKLENGAKSGSLQATFDWIATDGKKLLTERRTMTFHSGTGDNRIVDLDIHLIPADFVTFGDTKEGTFAIRIADAMTEKARGGQLVNASGATGMKNVWGKPSPWVDYAGTLEGEKVGIAIFDHPKNPKHPTYWHARDYGLFAANIFGEHDFFNDKSKNGALSLGPDPGARDIKSAAPVAKEMRFRYRIVIHKGDAGSAGIAKMYETWSK